MKNKVLAILAASAAVLGSAIFAAPAQAQTATLPVKIQVQPQIYLSTYKDLKFVVDQKDLQGAAPDQSVSYDESAAILPPNKVRPIGATAFSGSISRAIDPLYYVWANAGTNVTVKVTATGNTLTRTTPNPNASDTVTMSVEAGDTFPTPGAGLADSQAIPGKATLKFLFNNGLAPSAGSYDGGQLAITVATP
ncbi:hypothetical protein H6G81_24085 [Scytonema hofmannii FACHB-248]|uniref:Uncharacterized protein n=1 Tax=Scytonema hofmannii FACHB-248 TaxID=1842502 RepID=A0ABR8GX36_9CYAN|nr:MULTISPECIES: hypothetical protein [Nostocales]MBD2607521.1 hypothetical protein [Scytonema hofmannii FACHB-248]